ncbi:MAG: VOC family protein [Bryobacteraceae bacterium]
MQFRRILFLAALAGAPAFAQLAPIRSDRGVTMGHLHLVVRDVDAAKKFWTDFGGKPVKNNQLELIEFPNIYIMLRKGEPTGGSVGSSVNHVGFQARNSAEMVAKWNAAGIKTEKGNGAGQYYVTTDDGLRIEIQEDKTQANPLQFYHVHFNIPSADTAEAEAWYVRNFDAAPRSGTRYKTDDIPGSNLTLADVKEAAAPTKGRTLDHIGFVVNDLDSFAKRLEAQGVKFDIAPRAVNDGKTKVAFLTDKWGTYIELTEGLAPKP